MISRRTFIDGLAVTTAGLAIGSTAKSYDRILGANDRVNFAVMGLNSRGRSHLSALSANKDKSRVTYICDVDSNILEKYAGEAEQELGYAPKREDDFRKVLERPTWTPSPLRHPTLRHPTIGTLPWPCWG